MIAVSTDSNLRAFAYAAKESRRPIKVTPGGMQMVKRHKSTIACDISSKVRAEVMYRDEGRCIVCGSTNGIQIAHYISRARMGKGIPQNLGCMCHLCHMAYDQGHLHKEVKEIFSTYLKDHYKGWSEDALIYKKF
jgi:hypothetical protein